MCSIRFTTSHMTTRHTLLRIRLHNLSPERLTRYITTIDNNVLHMVLHLFLHWVEAWLEPGVAGFFQTTFRPFHNGDERKGPVTEGTSTSSVAALLYSNGLINNNNINNE